MEYNYSEIIGKPTKLKIRWLVQNFGKPYSSELGIDLRRPRKSELFKWFLASILFGARISEKIAIKTYYMFEKHKIVTPEDIRRAGWDSLVRVLDDGGYARYDFKTATKLIEISDALIKEHAGNLNKLHKKASNSEDLEKSLTKFKGVGDVTANIFLRELRGTWKKADPLPQEIAIKSAYMLGFTKLRGKNDKEKKRILIELKSVWKENKLPKRTFINFESALVRYALQLRRKRKLELLSG